MGFLYFVLLCTLTTCSLASTSSERTDRYLSICRGHLLNFIKYVCLFEKNSTIDEHNVLFIDCCLKDCTVKQIMNSFCPRDKVAIANKVIDSRSKSPEPDSTPLITTTKAPITVFNVENNNIWYKNTDEWFKSIKKTEEKLNK